MNIFYGWRRFKSRCWPATKADLEATENRIIMKASEVAENVNAAITTIRKGTDEVLGKIKALSDQLADAELPADAVTALENLKTAAKELDDIVPDAPTPVS